VSFLGRTFAGAAYEPTLDCERLALQIEGVRSEERRIYDEGAGKSKGAGRPS
jgi:hypothetical protein